MTFLDDAAAMLLRDFGYRVAVERRPGANGAAGPAEAHAPEDWGFLVGKVLGGHDMHDSIRDLAAKCVKAGMKAGAIVNLLRGVFEHSVRSADVERYMDIPRAVSSAECSNSTAVLQRIPCNH